MGDVWKWGAEVGGNCWRTTGDIGDKWGSMSAIGFAQTGHEAFAGPGHWNDTDMLVVGQVGWGPSLHPTQLKPNEQVTHITLWCLLAAPLLTAATCRPWTTSPCPLTNGEVLAVDQDPLGKPAGRSPKEQHGGLGPAAGRRHAGRRAVQPRPTGDRAGRLGGPEAQRRRKPVRDLWQRKDLGTRAAATKPPCRRTARCC